MDAIRRYELVSQIASGDFATVYRARDRELARDVAIKQIHQQFLHDPRQLERYWQEAQLLASLHHPYIMSIHDIVRSQGWLVLELMRGSLAGELQGRPIGVDMLHIALVQCLSALEFLHGQGIIHGDVKPSNLLVGMNHRLKLGDFGLARRAASSEGSLLKGTTKYMAPEVMSDQFGGVGPCSDLYSLGFSAYELLCGSHFESLFPGLSSFGRDKPVAWMMWHAAADRKLPEVRRVLEGVPERLALVVQKLIQKDQSLRYQSAAEVLRDLNDPGLRASGPIQVPATTLATASSVAAPVAAAPVDKRKRFLALAAFGASLVFSLGMLFLPQGGDRPDKKTSTTASRDERQGRIREVLIAEQKLILEVVGDRRPLEIVVPPDCEVQLNGKELILLREVQPGDQATLRLQQDQTRQLVAEHLAIVRPERASGRLVEFDAASGLVKLRVTVADGMSEIHVFQTGPELKPLLNGERIFAGQKVTLATLQADDQIAAEFFTEGSARRVVSLAALRRLTRQGSLRKFDPGGMLLTLADASDPAANEQTLLVAPDCIVSLNREQARLADLLPGDRLSCEFDSHLRRVDATRGP